MTIRLQPPFSKAQLLALHAVDYDFVYKHYRKELELALNPPPPPPPPPDFGARISAISDVVADEYKKYLKIHGGENNSFTWDAFMKEKNHAAQLKVTEAVVERWLEDHPEFVISEGNRKTMWDYLSEHDLSVSGEDLDKAFTAVRSSLVLDETKLPYDLNEPDTRVGSYKNGVFRPYDPGNSQNTIKAPLGLGQLDPSKVAAGEKQVTKSVRQQSAAEFLANINSSPSFRKKMDAA